MTASPMILVVEDEPRIAEVMLAYLQHAGYRTHHLDRGDQVLALLATLAPDLMLLDLMLPGLDGIELCRALRRQSQLRVIMVTARVEEIDRLLGFEVGADDYLCKPFSPKEMIARVQALLRRSQPRAEAEAPALLRLDAVAERIYCADAALPLTPQEDRLFAVLLAAPGRIFSRAQLLDLAYRDCATVFDRAIDSHIKNLRRKLAPALGPREVIHSVYGVGYRFELN